jgi:hypothetical protein
MSFNIRTSMALLLAGVALAGCAAEGNSLFTTGALGTQQAAAPPPEAKVDPVCVTLAARIEALRKEGIADKIEKAATKKYKMTNADLAKADQLTKVNADFQLRCSTITPRSVSAPLPPSAAAAPAPAPTVAARPRPAPKAAASAASTTAASQN